MFNSPLIAIVAVVDVGFIGLVPTLYHAWLNPQEETWQTFAVLVFASGLTLLSLSAFSTTSLSYPVYLLLANGSLAGVIVYRRTRLGHALGR